MNAIDQLVRELQDRKPQWGSEDEFIATQKSSRRPSRVRSVSRPSHQEWMRTILLSGLVVAGLIALQHERSGASQNLAVAAPKLANSSMSSNAIPATTPQFKSWQMDWRLSLDKLRVPVSPQAESASTNVALSPSHDLSQDAEVEVKTVTPTERLATALMHGNGPLTIDPPAAGRTQSVSNQVQTQYRRAMDLLEQGRETAALDLLAQVLSLDPHHVAARRLAISVATDHQQAAQAQIWLDEGVKLHPEDAELRTLQARLLSQAGAAEEAVGILQDLPHPHAEALGLKAGLLVKLGRHAQAAGAYEQALKAQPDKASWWLGLGVSWQAQGQSQAAREAFARAWQLGQQGQLSPDVQAWLEQQL